MNIGNTTIQQMFDSMKDYNPTIYSTMDKISTALIPIGLTLISLFFLLEMLEWYKMLDPRQGGITLELFASIAIKFAIAYVLVLSSGAVLDFIVWLNIAVAKLAYAVVPHAANNPGIPAPKPGLNFFQKAIIYMFYGMAQMFEWAAELVVMVLLFLRMIRLYVYKGVAPVIVPTFVNDELRSTAMGFLKQFTAAAFQIVLLTILIGLYPALMSSNFIQNSIGDFTSGGAFIANLGQYFVNLAESIIFIIVLIQSQAWANRMIGAL